MADCLYDRSKILFAKAVCNSLFECSQCRYSSFHVHLPASAFFNCVAHIFRHQAQMKVRSKVARSNSLRDPFKNGTSRRAFSEDGSCFRVIEASSVNQRERFSK